MYFSDLNKNCDIFPESYDTSTAHTCKKESSLLHVFTFCCQTCTNRNHDVTIYQQFKEKLWPPPIGIGWGPHQSIDDPPWTSTIP